MRRLDWTGLCRLLVGVLPAPENTWVFVYLGLAFFWSMGMRYVCRHGRLGFRIQRH